MAKRIEWKCDGCGRVDYSDHAADPPRSWDIVLVTVQSKETVSTEAGDAASVTAELCQKCATHLRERCDPRKWPRSSAEPTE